MPSVSLPAIIGLAGTAAGAASSISNLVGGGSSAPNAGAAGSTTTTQVQTPWSGQQPYLLQGFSNAGNLLSQGGPQYYPGSTFAAPNAYQTGGIDALAAYGSTPSATGVAASNTDANLLNGTYLNGNPANSTYAGAAAGNLGANTGSLFAPIATGQYQNTAGVDPLAAIASGQTANLAGVPTLSAAADGSLTNTAGTYPLTQAAYGGMQNWAGGSTLANIAAQNYTLPGQGTLASIANGDNLSASNPYFQQMAGNIAASVLPQIQSQFASGNRLDSGLASRAAASGLADSIGNLAYNNYQQGLTQQQGAAGTLAGLGEQNVGNSMNAALGLGNLGQQNINTQLGAAGQLSGQGAQNLATQLGAAGQLSGIGQQGIGNIMGASQALSGIGQNNIGNMLTASQGLTGVGLGNSALQLQGAQGLAGTYGQGIGQMIQGLALAPQTNQMPLSQIGALQQAGGDLQSQQQAALNDAQNRWNYNANLPYQALNQYIGQIQGNYGGTTTNNQPYFQNSLANGLATAGSLAGIGNSLFGNGGLGGIFGGGGSLTPAAQIAFSPTTNLGSGLSSVANNIGNIFGGMTVG